MRQHIRRKRWKTIGTIAIVSILFTIILIVASNFITMKKENTSKAQYSNVTIKNNTNLGDEYGLKQHTASTVNKGNSSQELLTVASSFYNYRSNHEIEKGWRDQGIDGELSGVGIPFSIFNEKLSEYYKAETASTKSFGTYLGNFYNYWKGSYLNYNWCLDNYTNFHWAQNIANRKNYSAVCQGLIGNNLSGYSWTKDAYTSGTLQTNNGSTAFPYFNKTFLETKYKNTDNLGIGVVAENVGFPFRYAHDSQKGSYYVFDSKYDVVRFANSESEGCTDTASTYKYYYGVDSSSSSPSLNYYYKQNQVSSRQNKSAQFFPFNKPTSANNLDFGFGMRVDIPFYLTSDGKQTDADGGNPMKFNFEGDDDVWVYIDGNLVLDLGGAHAKAKGSIDFSTSGNTATVTVDKIAKNNNNNNTTANTDNFEATNSKIESSTTTVNEIEKDKVHVLTVFYMERGMIESNLYMDFNFIPYNEKIAEPETDTTQKAESTLNVKTKIDFNPVASVFQDKVKTLAEDDAFRYKIENAGTTANQVQDSDIKYPSGELSVRENQGKRTYWSFGKAPKVRVYFDLQSAKEKAQNMNIDVNGNDSVHDQDYDINMAIWTTQPYILINGTPPKAMTQYNNSDYYYYDIDVGTRFCFTNKGINEYEVNGNKKVQTSEYTTDKDTNGILYIAKGFAYRRQSEFLCETQIANDQHPASDSVEHSVNLPYQTPGSATTFTPTNSSGYNQVLNTSYKLTESHLVSNTTYDSNKPDEIQIIQNNTKTSGITDSTGLFSLLSDDSATFSKQFIAGSNMRIVQQDDLGIIINRPETVKDSSKVTVSHKSGYFKENFSLTLTPSLATGEKATYSINGATAVPFESETTLTIGEGCEENETVTVKVIVIGTNNSIEFEKTYTYTKKPFFAIRVKKSDFTSAPYLYLYNATGSSDNEPNGTWPGKKMTEDGDYYIYINKDITSATAILSLDNWRSTANKEEGLSASGYMELEKKDSPPSLFKPIYVYEDNSIQTASITKGTRKTSAFYSTTVSASAIDTSSSQSSGNTSAQDTNNITVKGTGEFQLANTTYETFTNTVKTGNLSISKKITGMKTTDTKYTFTIKFKDVFGVSDGEYKGYALEYTKSEKSGSTETQTLAADNPTITLQAGEKVVFKGIPAGTRYQITETTTTGAVTGDISVSYSTKGQTEISSEPEQKNPSSADLTQNEVAVTKGNTGIIEGIIPTSVINSSSLETVDEFDSVDVDVTFTNQKGVLRIEKLAIGEWKNFKDEEYTFTIKKGNTTLDSNYKYDIYEYDAEGNATLAKDKNGNSCENLSITEGQIKLKAKQWAVIQDISLSESDDAYTIAEENGSYYHLAYIDDNTNANDGNATVIKNSPNNAVTVHLSNTTPTADVTFTNQYDPAYVTIEKYIDALYYQTYDNDKKQWNEKAYSDGITYQDLTNTTQSFVFTILEYNSEDDATKNTNSTRSMQITIPMQSSNLLKRNDTFSDKDYRYKNKKTIKLTLGKYYRISEDTNWSWKYDLKGINSTVTDSNGSVTVDSNAPPKHAIFQGGSKDKSKTPPIISFYNTLTIDNNKLSTDGDTDVNTNIIKRN